MYVPIAFQQKDRNKLHDFIEAYSFGLLVTTADGEPTATHLPFLLERDVGHQGDREVVSHPAEVL